MASPYVAFAAFVDSAFLVNASSQYFTATDAASLEPGSNNLTLEGWFYFTSGAHLNGLAGKSNTGTDQRAYRWYQDGAVMHLIINTDGTSGTNQDASVGWNPQANTWFHLAAVFDQGAGSVKFYVATSTAAANPTHVQIGTTVTGIIGPVFNGNAPYTIGLESVDNSNFFDGNIFLDRMWSASRSTAQLDASSCTLLGLTSNLGGEWSLDNTLNDNSGNSNTLTAVNGAVVNNANVPASCNAVAGGATFNPWQFFGF